jgi:hypothetical protein
MKKHNLNRPESIPGMNLPVRDYVKSFLLSVVVYDLKTDKIILDTKMDYGNQMHRKWLGKLTFFCCTSGYSVETMALTDREKDK